MLAILQLVILTTFIVGVRQYFLVSVHNHLSAFPQTVNVIWMNIHHNLKQ